MSDRGFWTLIRWRGAPVRVHWSLAVSAVVLGGFRLNPAGWLGIVLVVLAHEFGHAVLVRRYRLTVERIDLHGLGGECAYRGYATPWQTAVIAWGGVLAQALLLPVGFGLAPRVDESILRELLLSFGTPSLWMLLFNLLPVAPLDGHQAWNVLGLWRNRRRAEQRQSQARQRREEFDRMARGLADIESRDDLAPSDLELPNPLAEQIARAVRRAYEPEEPPQ